MPELSIIMPLFNTGRYAGDAVQSLLSQSFSDFELIVVDDASTDGSAEVIRSFRDPRINMLTNEKNQGIAISRNIGLRAATGKYIAPFDSDDMAMPQKFEKQVDFLKRNPDFGMVGSWAKLIDGDGNTLPKKWKPDAPAERIPAILLFRNYFIQSAVVLRREIIPEGGYRPGFNIAEDYFMWTEIAQKSRVWNFPEYLVYHRIHDRSAIGSDAARVALFDARVFEYAFERLGITLDEHALSLMLKIKNETEISRKEELDDIEILLIRILRQNSILHIFDNRQLKKVVFNRWMKACSKGRKLHFSVLKKLVASPLTKLAITSAL